MFGWLKSHPVKKLKKRHAQLLEQAMNAQRNGDIRSCSHLSLKADELWKEIEKLEGETQRA